jgi:hypothetical protein
MNYFDNKKLIELLSYVLEMPTDEKDQNRGYK